jgi:pantoate--beta-alanine ligase
MSSAPLRIVRTLDDLRPALAAWRAEGQRIALVPTMGALHDGHLSLIRLGRQKADRVVASLFVNPAQFAPSEDFQAYPRDEARDARLLAETGCDLLYAPSTDDIYPQGFATCVTVSGVSAPLEGASRPQHFAGVATVVAKLLIRAAPDAAVFGEKDYQQLLVVRRLARDLDLSVEIVGAPTIRAEDGLALSSRNAYLSDSERAVAGRLNVVLRTAAGALGRGETVEAVEARGHACLGKAGFASVDYFEARDAEDLGRIGPGPVERAARVLAAVRVGATRLIDNWPV